MVLNDLPSATKLYFVVRARDGGWNRDTNTSEVSGVTNVSFSGDVQPIFTMSCAVVGCHVPGLRPGDLVLSPGFALKEMLNVDAAQRPPGTTSAMKRVLPGDPSNSYLVRKILAETGKYAAAPMPALNTGNTLSEREKQLIVDWIAQGAGSN